MDHFVLIADAALFIIIFLLCAIKGMITKKILIFIPLACAISSIAVGLLLHFVVLFIDNQTYQYSQVGNILVLVATFLMMTLGYFCLIAYSKIIGETFSRIHKIIISTLVGLSLPYCIAIMVIINTH